MPVVLAIETSSDACSVALRGPGVDLRRHEVVARSHTRRVMPMVREVLADAGLTLSSVSAIALGAGPGSFTGLRIAAGVVQGLAYGAGLPVIPVSSLAALAWDVFERHPEQDQVAVCIDARMGEVYLGQYRREGATLVLTEPDRLVAPADVSVDPVVARVGNGWALLPAPEPVMDAGLPSAAGVAALALARFEAGERHEALAAQPLYLRDEVAWKKLPGRE